MEAGAETGARMMAYENKLDSLTRENIRLQMQLNARTTGGNKGPIQAGDYVVAAAPVTRLNKLTQSLVNGSWVTSDGAEKWVFNNGQLQISSAQGYTGAFEAQGTYESGGGKANGKIHITRLVYLPVDMDAFFEVSLGSNNTTLIGNLHRDGKNTPMALYKQL